jgi:ElaB/YqjD/DUF883 family membrane-anchored ribosome-binding protein
MQKNGMTGDMNQRVDDKIDSIKESVKGFVDQSSHAVDQIKSRVVDVKDQAMSRGGDLIEQLATVIKAHPLQAVGIAFGAGYVGMRLFRR